jgi:hypothetical protein
MKGAYPRNFDTGFWDESDYEDPDLRRSMRDGYEQHLEMLAFVYNNYVKALYEAIPHVESEYNSLVINSRNMEQAVKLFSDKYEEAIIAVENELDTNRLLRNYLAPLKEHGIITFDERNDYQELVCRIGILYNDAVHVVCKVFDLELPWNHVNPNAKQIPNNKVEENESSTPDTDIHTEMQQSTISAHTDSFASSPSQKKPKDIGNHTKPKGNRGRKSAFSNLREKSLVAIIESIHDNRVIFNCNIIAESIKNEIKNCKEDKERAPLVVALEVCELIPVLEGDKVNAFCVILNKEMGNIIEYRTFIKHYKNNSPLREKAMKQETKSVNELNLKEIIYWKKKFQEMMIKSKKSALK